MTRKINRSREHFLSLPSVVFALAFVLLGWIASHSITYTLAGFMSHDDLEWHVHGYLDVLKLSGGGGLVLAFSLALRSFFRHGSFGKWLHEGGVAGTRKQVALAAILPAAVFVLVEYLERIAAGTGTSPSFWLLVVGVLVQLVVGLLCLVLVRVTFRVTERVIGSLTRDLLVRHNRGDTGLAPASVFFANSLCPMADSAAGRAPPFPIAAH